MNQAQNQRSIRVSVPGKIFLAGEYAILRGGRCLAAAVDARLNVDIAAAPEFSIRSDLWQDERRLDPGSAEPLMESLRVAAERNSVRGARIDVISELDVAHGLGSSSAVRLGAHLGLHAFAKQDIALSSEEIWDAARDAWRLQRGQQGFASGYDLVTQVKGGFIEWTADYERWPGVVRTLDNAWLKDWVHPYAGGRGAPTKEVGGSVRSWLDTHDLWPELSKRSDTLIDALLAQDWERIARANTNHRSLFAPAPFYPQALDKVLASAHGFDRSWTFKTTGAGGEDAILVIGHASRIAAADEALRGLGWKPLASAWTEQGTSLSWKDRDHDRYL